MNILLVEDDAGLVELITVNLEELGFLVRSAASGAEALAHLEKQTPDLMLLDYSLPDINGKELIETLIKQQIFYPPFIMTTGQGDERIAVNMMKLGAMDYLVKDMLFLEKIPNVVQRVIKEIESDGKLKQVEKALIQSEATIRNKLKAITEPKGDISKLELSDIIDTEGLQSMMEDFYQLTGMLGAVLDLSGKVLVAVGWQDICTKFHRCNATTLKNCIESDTILTQGVSEGTFKSYHCKNNMWDIVTPIMLGGRHVGNVFMGQYFMEDEVPDIEFFRKQAQKHEFDEAAYLAALDRVPRFSKETVDAGMRFYSKLAGIISTMSYSSIQQSRMLAQQKQTEKDLIKAKEKAEENERLYKDLVQSSHNLIWKCDLEGKFTFLNSAWENTHGYKVEEMLGRPFSDFQRPEIFERDVIEFTKHLEGGFVKGYETTHIIEDGTEITLIFNALPLFNTLGEIIGTQGTAFDISKLKQTESDLIKAKENAEESEDRLRGFMDSATDGFMLFDSELNQIDINDVALRITKQKREEIIGRSMLEVVPDLIKSGRYDKFMDVISTGNPITFDDIVPHTNFGDIRISLKAFKVAQGLGIILTDITEGKKAEDLLKVSEERFRKLYTDTPAIMHSMDKDGRIQNVSKRWLEKLGYEMDEVLGHKSTEFLTDKSRQFAIEQSLPKFLKEGFIDNVPYQYLTKGGDMLDILLSAISEKDKNGNVKLSLAVLEDITERKLAEEALKESEEKYRSLIDDVLDTSSVGIFILDSEFKVAWINKATEEYFGIKRENVIGKDKKQLINSEIKGLFEDPNYFTKKVFDTYKDNNYIENFECHITIGKDREERWLSHWSQPIIEGLYKNGRIEQYTDITDRKRAEEKMITAEQNLKNTFDISPSIICKVNVETGYFVELNQAVTRILGYSIEELGSKPLMEFIHPDDRLRTSDLILELIDGNKTTFFENRYLCKDGSYKWMEWNATKADKNNMVTAIANDITEKKQTEKNLQNTFDLSPSIIAKANMNEGRFVQVNKAVTKILGYSIDEFTSRSYMEFVHPDDRQNTIDIATEQLKGNDVTFFENRYLCEDGTYKWMAWHGTKPDKNGIVTTIGSDINERKTIEQEIVKTKQFYENITEGVQDGIWVTDKNDIIFYANKAVEKIAGASREQIQGNNLLKDFPEETTGELIKFYKQAKKEKKPTWYGIKVRTLANKDTWQNGWLIPQYQDKKFTGIICTIRDVTEQKLAESSVRKLSTAVEQSPSIIVITDTDGKLVYVNPKFTELTGFSSAEAIGQESNILKSGEQDIAFYEKMWEIVESGKVWRGQFHNKKKNGELFWEAASISAILNESGDVVNFIKIGEDITQQKMIEAELKVALEKALESDRLKSAFLANMSHEIRTPMNGILGFINLLNEPDLSKVEIEQYSAVINRSGERLLTTINDIIDISRIESGEMAVLKEKTSINNMMDELYSFYAPEVKQKGLSLLLKPVSEQLTIITDSHKLHGVFTNLIKNALKFTEKGSITFGYLLKKDSMRKKQPKYTEVEFFVEDTGTGIPEDRIQAIFKRFEQADIEDSRAFEGSGLGLAISKAYVEMLGGEIFVESKDGKGSKFTFTIPLNKTK